VDSEDEDEDKDDDENENDPGISVNFYATFAVGFRSIRVERDLKRADIKPMKRKLVPVLIGLSAVAFLAGCSIDCRFGGGSKTNSAATTANNTAINTANNNQHPVVQQTVAPTVGQQLLDLKKALNAGAISEQEYETEKARILNQK
jgi:hypothetical protein